MAFGMISLWEKQISLSKYRMREGSKEEGTGEEGRRLHELFNTDVEAWIPKLVLCVSYNSIPFYYVLLPPSTQCTFLLLASRFTYVKLQFLALAAMVNNNKTPLSIYCTISVVWLLICFGKRWRCVESLKLLGAKAHCFVLFLPFLVSCYSFKPCIIPCRNRKYLEIILKVKILEIILKVNAWFRQFWLQMPDWF